MDNITKCRSAYSILIAPIYGHNSSEDGSNNIVGILQLVNKNDGKITPYDMVSQRTF
jgi:hypothetical protein